MTVPASNSRAVVVANGVTTSFALPIQLKDPETLEVTMLHAGVWTSFAQPADYQVVISDSGFATAEFVEPPPSGAKVVFRRASPRTQETDFINGSVLRAETIENALDRVVLLLQEVDDTLARAVKVDTTAPWSSPPAYDVEPPAAGKVLVARTDETGWEHKTLAQLGGNVLLTPVAVAEGGTGASTPAAARLNLGVGNTALTWTAPQTFPAETRVKEASATAVFTIGSDSTTLSPVARIRAHTKNDANVDITPAQLTFGAGSRSPGAENGWMTLATRRAGSLTEELGLEGGLRVGSAPGGYKGVGTVNATEYYKNGAVLPQPQIFISDDIVFSNGTYFTAEVDHPFGVPPNMFQALLKCITPEHGYGLNDRVTFFSDATGMVHMSVWASSTKIGINIDSGFRIRHKTSDSTVTPDPAKWRLIFRAIYIPV